MAQQNETNSAAADLPPIDLRSDTVTKPTEAMYARMASAPLGDDGLDGDPTARELEAVAAVALGKEAGLFVPSCTLANLLATLAQSERSEQVVLESTAHMYVSERGAATLTGLFHLPVAGTAGAMDLNLLEDALQGEGLKLKTALVAMETSHNNASGAVLPLEHMQAVHAMASSRGVPVHLDGARIFNAATALGVAPDQVARHCDTVALCLSKGLSAPAGAVLAGPRAVIDRSRRFRRMLGGSQRQIGVLAAAGLEAVQVMGQRLAQDHRRARALSDALNKMHPEVSATIPQTNIVQVDVSRSGRDGAAWSAALEKAGVKARPWGKQRLRCVTHRHIDDADIDRAAMTFRLVAETFA
ncbi:threonine aldolase [Bradyrhizobium nitroreducens]|uniref:Threonine aldolase n=1 Tax=Bradyrhizobium nitroreducens TaxID=709803 RepID=A0A2M6UAG7_9BRAD|nr:GntG family PLP-dependent aldolase [Bradyrhizobium nitroreducens]PIT01537.1 threonine aldolase [Bradyrhizobium nitroreducens]